MQLYRIEFFSIADEHFLIDYVMMFNNRDEAIEWALLTAQTSNTMKIFDMEINIKSIPTTKTIYYYADQ